MVKSLTNTPTAMLISDGVPIPIFSNTNQAPVYETMCVNKELESVIAY